MSMTQYRVINKDLEEVEVNQAELFRIAEHWVEDNNEYIPYDESKWELPGSMCQVEEIIVEYMQCELIYPEEETDQDTLEMYHSLIS